MDDKIAKTISTVAIWLATMVIFVFGVFRFNWNGLIAGVFWFCIASALAYGATASTIAIWKAGENTPK